MSDKPTSTFDPRQGFTSASNAGADARCPGRHLMQKGIVEPAQSAEATSGQKIHAALAAFTQQGLHDNRPLLDRLTVSEQKVYQDCLNLQRKLSSEFVGDKVEGYREFREQRYWIKFKAGQAEYQHSGQADFVGHIADRLLIIDYKTLYGEKAASSRNMQLRDLACLAAGNIPGVKTVRVVIVQPLVTMEPKPCDYTEADIKRATKEMCDRVVASNQANAKRVAGDIQCEYCLGKSKCVEYQKWAGQITPPAMLSILGVPMAAWTPEQCAIAAGALAPAQKFLDDLKAMLKSKLQADPKSVPGWALKPGAVREVIDNPQGLFERWSALGGTPAQFMTVVEIAKGKLEKALADLTGAKGKQLSSAMGTLTHGLVTEKRTAPSLVKEKS